MPNETEVTYYGLINQGATCYLNSVLQVLFRTKEFREAVNRLVIDSNSQKIDRHLKDLFEDLQEKQTNPSAIIKALDINSAYVQQDAAEYLEKVLKLTSPQAAKIFQGKLSHTTTCKVCQNVTDSIGPFWHLPLELLDSKEIYSVKNGIKELFEPTVFEGENQMYCEKCDTKVDASRQYVIADHPDVLLLLLKRFDFSYQYMSYVKINCEVDFPYELQIPENQTYELYSVVDHFGDLRSGHYSATIKSQEEETIWYIFDDTYVSKIEPKSCQGNEEIARSTNAYLLFYRRKAPEMENHLKARVTDKSETARSPTLTASLEKNVEKLQLSSIETDQLSDRHLKGVRGENDNLYGTNDQQTFKEESLAMGNRDARDACVIQQGGIGSNITKSEDIEKDKNSSWGGDRNTNSTDPNVKDDGIKEHAVHREKQTDASDFRPELNETQDVPIDGMTDESRDEDQESDCEEKHFTGNNHGEDTASKNTNIAEQKETKLSGDIKADIKDARNQSEIKYANQNGKEQKGEREDNKNALLLVGNKTDIGPQRDCWNSTKTDGKDETLKIVDDHNGSDKNRMETAFKAEGEIHVGAIEAGCHHNSVGDGNSEKSKPKYDQNLVHNVIYKDQTQNNENVNFDIRDNTDFGQKNENEERSKPLMAQCHQDKCTSHKKKGDNEEEANCQENKHGLKNRTKRWENNDDVEDSHKQQGNKASEREIKTNTHARNAEDSHKLSEKEEINRKGGNKTAEEQKETSIKNTRKDPKGSAGERHSSRQSARVPEGVSSGISISDKKKKESKVVQHLTEEQVNTILVDNPKNTSKEGKRQAAKHKMPEASSMKNTFDAQLAVAEGNLTLKKRRLLNHSLLCFRVRKTQGREKSRKKKKKKKKRKNKILKFMCFSTNENVDSD